MREEQDLDGAEVSRENFPLPKLSHMLDAICRDVYEGKGFDVVRGLDPEAWSTEDLTVVYFGLSSYIGEVRGKQDQRGSMISKLMYQLKGFDILLTVDPVHVMKYGNDRDLQYCANKVCCHSAQQGSGIHANVWIKPFHTDTVTDVICLFARNLAARGGCSFIAPAWQVYNEIAATRPDLIHTLSQSDWPFDTSVSWVPSKAWVHAYRPQSRTHTDAHQTPCAISPQGQNHLLFFATLTRWPPPSRSTNERNSRVDRGSSGGARCGALHSA